jgi:hypothetical protein
MFSLPKKKMVGILILGNLGRKGDVFTGVELPTINLVL